MTNDQRRTIDLTKNLRFVGAEASRSQPPSQDLASRILPWLVAGLVINGGENCHYLRQPTRRRKRMLQASPLTRSFAYLSLKLPDPDSKLTVEEVRHFTRLFIRILRPLR
jgi:hypothetical protein